MYSFILRPILWTRQVSSVFCACFLSIPKIHVLSDELVAFPCFAFPVVWASILWKFANKWFGSGASDVVPSLWIAETVEFGTVFTTSAPVVRFIFVPACIGYLLFLVRGTSEVAFVTFVISCVVNSNPSPERKLLNYYFKLCTFFTWKKVVKL